MADIEIKRGYEVLPDNNVRFGIRMTNTSDLAISDVEIILDYSESLFKLEGERMQKVGVIPPASTRTAEFVLKPLDCVHKVNIEALISYRDAKYARQRIDMHPKEVHCVCPFLKGKAMPKAKFLELSNSGHSAETGLNFKGVGVDRLASYLVQTCKNRHHKVDDYSVDGGRMLYLASESIGEKAYYLLTALIKDDDGITQVMLRVASDKPHGLNGFLNETVAELRHVTSTVQSAQEIGVIRKEQVINIIDSIVQRTSFGGAGGEGGGGASVNIEGSLVQRTEFNAGEDRRVEEERLRVEREEEERLRKAQEAAEIERKEEERKAIEEKEEKKRQEELRKKQDVEMLRKQEAQRKEQVRKAQAEGERKAKEEVERKAREIDAWHKQKTREEQERIARKKSKKRTNVFMLAIVLGALFVGFVMFAPGSGDINDVSTPSPSFNQKYITNSIGMEFVLIPAGEFDMGSLLVYKDMPNYVEPVHKVNIPYVFYLGKYEVTNKQWREIMGDNPNWKVDNLPIEGIQWYDIQEFIQKLNEKEGTDKYRLPSEAEWEYACRAGTTTRYSFGDDMSKLDEYTWNDGRVHPVGQKKPNPWGLYDMYGNGGFEWVQDSWHSDYNGAPVDGSAWEGESDLRVVRGVTSALRGFGEPDHNTFGISFRLLKEM